METVHGNGKVNLTESKVEKTQTKRGEASLMGTRLRTENEDSMQREKVMEIILMVKPEVKEKNMLQLLNTGPGEKENQICQALYL